MKKLFLVIAVVGAGIVGLGFYQGWFLVASTKDDGKSNVTLSVDTDKFQEDRKTAQQRVQAVGTQIKDTVAGPSEKTMEGTVVSVSADKLTMTNKEGKDHSHTLAANVNVTCDGKVCTVADLRSGMRIRVTTEHEAPHAATRIEALDNKRDFEKGV
jgi:hypothetical protein